jgi:hypothetical protein
MANQGFRTIDSDLHLMEPDDLWLNYLDEPYRARPPRFFGPLHETLTANPEDRAMPM